MFLTMMIVAASVATVMLILPLVTNPRGEVFPKKEKMNWSGWAIIICAVLAFACSIWSAVQQRDSAIEELKRHSQLIGQVELEALRLVPSDFQIRLTSSSANNPGQTLIQDLRPIHVEGMLGKAHILCELVEVGDHRQESVMVTEPEFYGLPNEPGVHGYSLEAALDIRYFAHNVTCTDLENYPNLYDLEGVRFELELPVRRLEIRSNHWTHKVDFYVKGRHFAGTADSLGIVNIPISFGGEDG